jgi:ABC-type Fe3+/spermidine/putrescine transport system ATPase subunit
MIAGFVPPTAGRIFIGDRDVTALPPYRRDTGMVFQQYALFPHLTIAENVAYGLKVRRLPKRDVGQRVTEALQLVRMDHLADRRPSQISGGQKQRVALARAVVIRPQVLLLDEPLAALDLKLREELQVEIKRVQQAVGITTVFVTHDQGEALSLSDRVVVMSQGKILQVDAPGTLYQRPANKYVASFIGQMNFLDVTVHEIAAEGARQPVRAPSGVSFNVGGSRPGTTKQDDKCVLAFRPEDARLGDEGGNRLQATVTKVTYVGNSWTLSCLGPHGETLTVLLHRNVAIPPVGAPVTVGWDPADCMLLEAT